MSHPTPAKAIRLHCLGCSGGAYKEVELCQVSDCPLWPWRFGKRPQTIGKQNPGLLDPNEVKAKAYRQCCREMLAEAGEWVRSSHIFGTARELDLEAFDAEFPEETPPTRDISQAMDDETPTVAAAATPF